ncbi:hypothetical protein, partial [Burkholderia multivorans]|uniref:hypothetical protein n=1 Tax=Burkholderia multivorans TaxID=87883 RepID=UPI0021BF1B3D
NPRLNRRGFLHLRDGKGGKDPAIRHDRPFLVFYSRWFAAQTMIRKIGKNLPGITADSFSPILCAPSDR